MTYTNFLYLLFDFGRSSILNFQCTGDQLYSAKLLFNCIGAFENKVTPRIREAFHFPLGFSSHYAFTAVTVAEAATFSKLSISRMKFQHTTLTFVPLTIACTTYQSGLQSTTTTHHLPVF